MSEHDASPCEVVGAHFDIDFIADHDANTEFSHFSCGVSDSFVSIFEFDTEHGVG